jgi:hypothetical protein
MLWSCESNFVLEGLAAFAWVLLLFFPPAFGIAWLMWLMQINVVAVRNSAALRLLYLTIGSILVLWAFEFRLSISSYVYLIAGVPVFVSGVAGVFSIAFKSILACESCSRGCAHCDLVDSVEGVRADLARVEDAVVRRRGMRSRSRARPPAT